CKSNATTWSMGRRSSRRDRPGELAGFFPDVRERRFFRRSRNRARSGGPAAAGHSGRPPVRRVSAGRWLRMRRGDLLLVLVLVLDCRFFDYENEEDDEDDSRWVNGHS